MPTCLPSVLRRPPDGSPVTPWYIRMIGLLRRTRSASPIRPDARSARRTTRFAPIPVGPSNSRSIRPMTHHALVQRFVSANHGAHAERPERARLPGRRQMRAPRRIADQRRQVTVQPGLVAAREQQPGLLVEDDLAVAA